MGVKCDIKLDRKSYFPGQTIFCEVNLDFEEAKKIKGISVRFKGECGTKWTRGAGKSTMTYSADEEYFRTYIYVVGEKEGQERDHPAGQSKYQVQFTLPSSLPSSYIGRYGFIRYTVKVHVEVAALKIGSKFIQEYNVVAPIDLNFYSQSIRDAICLEHSKQFTCCCIPLGGTYKISIHLPCTGYSNEQKIPIMVECSNQSKIYVRGLKIALRKLITYHSTTPHKESKREDIKLSVIKFDVNVNKQQTKQFSGELLIPASTALNLDCCNLIDVSHRLEISTLLSGCQSNFVFDLPLTIGHFSFANHPCSRTKPPTYEIAMLTTPTL